LLTTILSLDYFERRILRGRFHIYNTVRCEETPWRCFEPGDAFNRINLAYDPTSSGCMGLLS